MPIKTKLKLERDKIGKIKVTAYRLSFLLFAFLFFYLCQTNFTFAGPSYNLMTFFHKNKIFSIFFTYVITLDGIICALSKFLFSSL